MRDDLLLAGVTGLSKSTAVGSHWFHGHFGAAVLAGHALLNDTGIPAPIRTRIERRADAIVRGASALCAPGDAAREEPIDPKPILDALERHVAVLRNSGHGTIYAGLALRAMSIEPRLSTPTHCNGIAALVEIAADEDPDRYYGAARERDIRVSAEQVPEFDSLDDALAYAIDECAEAYDDTSIDGRRYFFHGQKIHGVTHVHALCQLERLGHRDLARSALPAVRRQLFLNRQIPPGRPAPRRGTDLIPTDAGFWDAEATDGLHLLKLAHASMDAADRLGQPRESVWRALRAVWSLPA